MPPPDTGTIRMIDVIVNLVRGYIFSHPSNPPKNGWKGPTTAQVSNNALNAHIEHSYVITMHNTHPVNNLSSNQCIIKLVVNMKFSPPPHLISRFTDFCLVGKDRKGVILNTFSYCNLLLGSWGGGNSKYISL